jgi:O-antigen ligase
MQRTNVEQKLATYLAFGTFFVSVFLLPETNTDPVNVTKLFALGGVSVAGLLVSIAAASGIERAKFNVFIAALLIFNLIMFVDSALSKAPFSQNYFGTFGRNNGLLTYLLLSLICFASLGIRVEASFVKIFIGLFAAGLLNIIYCAWVLAFGDFIPWNNPYGNILGLLGNPDFISAFLGIFIAGSLSFMASPKFSGKLKLTLGLSSIVALFEIVKSHAIQGFVVTAGGIVIVGFYLIRSRFKNQLISIGYLIVVGIVGVFAVLGTLQKGPLSFVYKRSVSFRGTYWRTGIQMGKSNPWTGIGLDTYGDWYKRARTPVALIDTPGIKTLSNVSHNVVIDFFASGGFPLLLSYLAILAFGAISIIRVTLRTREYNRVFVGLSAVWLCYEVQSFISINQIGLAIWGWLSTGLLVAYERATRNEQRIEEKDNKPGGRQIKRQSVAVSPQLLAGIGLVIGLLIALPPLSADTKWFNATRSRDAAKVEAALAPSLFNPADSYRYAQAVNLFQSSNLPDLAHKYALIAVKFNPDYSDAWSQLYFLPNSTEAEKAQALSNMKRLDPKNPDVTATQ